MIPFLIPFPILFVWFGMTELILLMKTFYMGGGLLQLSRERKSFSHSIYIYDMYNLLKNRFFIPVCIIVV